MNERSAHSAMNESSNLLIRQSDGMRKAFGHRPMNDLMREFAPGVIEHHQVKLTWFERCLTVAIYAVSAGLAIAAVAFICGFADN